MIEVRGFLRSSLWFGRPRQCGGAVAYLATTILEMRGEEDRISFLEGREIDANFVLYSDQCFAVCAEHLCYHGSRAFCDVRLLCPCANEEAKTNVRSCTLLPPFFFLISDSKPIDSLELDHCTQ